MGAHVTLTLSLSKRARQAQHRWSRSMLTYIRNVHSLNPRGMGSKVKGFFQPQS
jgi:hypothetical protein